MKSSIPLAIALALSGCAVAPPQVTPQARSHYETVAQAVAKEGAALLVDSCWYRLEVGTSHVYPQLSEQHARAVAGAAASSLEARGIKLHSVQIPLLCTGFDKDYLLSLKQRSALGAELKPIEGYPVRAPGASTSSKDDGAVLGLMQAVAKAAPTIDRAPDNNVKPVALEMAPEQSQALSKLLGARYVWLVNLRTQDVSAGRAIGFVALTAGLSAGLTGGAYAGWSTNDDSIGETTALVDLATAQLVWKRQFNASGRGLVDFERPIPSAQLLRNWADTSGFVPFYEAPAKQ